MPVRDAQLIEWHQALVYFWSTGAHGQSEQFRLGVMYVLTDFQEKIIFREPPPEEGGERNN